VCGADLAGGMAWMIVMVRKSPVERRDGDEVSGFVEGPGLLGACSNPLRRFAAANGV
jgi:hypothetical protein